MALRKTIIATGQYCHTFNRGVARNPIFFCNKDYQGFLTSMNYYCQDQDIFIINYFGNKDKYFMFIKDFEDYKKSFTDIEYLTIDENLDEV